MSIVDKLKKMAKKKELPYEQQVENYVMSRYQLTKDPDEPNMYWINDRHYIIFDPADEESVDAAVTQLHEFYLKPQIQEATSEQIWRRKGPNGRGGGGKARGKKVDKDVWKKDYDGIRAGLSDMTNHFMEKPDWDVDGFEDPLGVTTPIRKKNNKRG